MDSEATESVSGCYIPESLTAYSAFQDQLRKLSLNEFPCGLGNWRAEEYRSSKHKGLQQQNNTQNRFSSTHKDYGVERETTETLHELVTSKYSPWKVDYSWSEDAKTLREMAVNSPDQINEKFILKHFNTLKIVDKGVTEVDSSFTKLKNLENLNLSANYLRSVSSRNLPKRLKTLELFGNQIDDLSELCYDPLPQVIHLGLGCNNLSDTGNFISSQFWSQLLSLDISKNNLVNLKDIIDKLETLPKLRNLILIGNPICLVPAYRGYVIDRLRRLDSFDDVLVTADEKHSYQGLASVAGSYLDTAWILIKVPFIRGVPAPEEIQNPDEQPEFPRVSRKYFVQFMLLEEVQPSNLPPKIDAYANNVTDHPSVQSDHNAMIELSPLTTDSISKNISRIQDDRSPFPDSMSPLPDSRNPLPDSRSPLPDSRNLLPHSRSPLPDSRSPLPDSRSPLSDSRSPLPDSNSPLQKNLMTLESQQSSTLIPMMTATCDWTEDMALNWANVVARSNLLALRNFIQEGMTISVMEEKILSYPAPDTEATRESSADRKGKKKVDKRKETASLKKKIPLSKVKDKDVKNKGIKAVKEKKDDKKKKKKKQPDIDLVHSPAEYQTLASFHIPLASFLEGDYECEKGFSRENVSQSRPGSKSPSPERRKQKDKKDKGKPKSADKKKSTPRKGKEDKEKKKGVKGKGGKGKPATSLDEDETPRPLEVQVSVKLRHWKTAAEHLETEEDFLNSA